MSRAPINFKKQLKLWIQYLETIHKIDDLRFKPVTAPPIQTIRPMVKEYSARVSSWSVLLDLQLGLFTSKLVAIYAHELFIRYWESKPTTFVRDG